MIKEMDTSAIPSEPHGQAFGRPFFNCDHDNFSKCLHGRKKHKKWKSFLNDGTLTQEVRSFIKRNPTTPFLLRSNKTGQYIFANSNY